MSRRPAGTSPSKNPRKKVVLCPSTQMDFYVIIFYPYVTRGPKYEIRCDTDLIKDWETLERGDTVLIKCDDTNSATEGIVIHVAECLDYLQSVFGKMIKEHQKEIGAKVEDLEFEPLKISNGDQKSDDQELSLEENYDAMKIPDGDCITISADDGISPENISNGHQESEDQDANHFESIDLEVASEHSEITNIDEKSVNQDIPTSSPRSVDGETISVADDVTIELSDSDPISVDQNSGSEANSEYMKASESGDQPTRIWLSSQSYHHFNPESTPEESSAVCQMSEEERSGPGSEPMEVSSSDSTRNSDDERVPNGFVKLPNGQSMGSLDDASNSISDEEEIISVASSEPTDSTGHSLGAPSGFTTSYPDGNNQPGGNGVVEKVMYGDPTRFTQGKAPRIYNPVVSSFPTTPGVNPQLIHTPHGLPAGVNGPVSNPHFQPQWVNVQSASNPFLHLEMLNQQSPQWVNSQPMSIPYAHPMVLNQGAPSWANELMARPTIFNQGAPNQFGAFVDPRISYQAPLPKVPEEPISAPHGLDGVRMLDRGTQTGVDCYKIIHADAIFAAYNLLKQQHHALRSRYQKIKTQLLAPDFLLAGSNGPISLIQNTDLSNNNSMFHHYTKDPFAYEAYEYKRNPLNNIDENIDMCERTIQIGSGGTRIPLSTYASINFRNFSSATRRMLYILFPKDVLATHSIKGKEKKLNPNIVSDIIELISSKCKIAPKYVENDIMTKCIEESLAYHRKLHLKEERLEVDLDDDEDSKFAKIF